MLRYIKLQVIIPDGYQFSEAEDNKNLGVATNFKDIVEDSAVMSAVISESDMSFIARIMPMTGLQNFPNLCSIEIEKIYTTGIIATSIDNVLGRPSEIMDTINKQLVTWWKEDEELMNETLSKTLTANLIKKPRKTKPKEITPN